MTDYKSLIHHESNIVEELLKIKAMIKKHTIRDQFGNDSDMVINLINGPEEIQILNAIIDVINQCKRKVKSLKQDQSQRKMCHIYSGHFLDN